MAIKLGTRYLFTIKTPEIDHLFIGLCYSLGLKFQRDMRFESQSDETKSNTAIAGYADCFRKQIFIESYADSMCIYVCVQHVDIDLDRRYFYIHNTSICHT